MSEFEPCLRRPFLTMILVLAAGTCLAGQPSDRGPGLVGFGPLELLEGPMEGDVAAPAAATESVPTVRFRWPLVNHDWWHLQNYVDLLVGPGIQDYGCQAVSYDGHEGNDIVIRDFVEQDEGRYVLAAAAGTVLATADGNFDENTSNMNCTTPTNYVVLGHSDNTETYYYHLRKWSVMVYPGQQVFEGQPIGLIGSSGCSTDPHLHLGVLNAGTVYEPSAGACRSGDSLWESQQAHVFGNPAELFYAGMSTVAPTADSIKFRPPDLFHVRQNGAALPHFFWVRLTDVHAGDVSRVTYYTPANAVWADWTLTHTTYFSGSWWFFQTDLPSSGSLGTWRIEYRLNGTLKATKTFTYDTAAYQPPVATGRSVTVSRGKAGDALRGSDADSDVKDFNATSPTHGEVRLSGRRDQYFTYVPESGFTGVDTFSFRVYDAQGAFSSLATMTMNVTGGTSNVLR